MKILVALLLFVACETFAQPITLQRGRLWGDSLAWQTPEEFIFGSAEDANLLFIPHAMRYILVYDLQSGTRSDTIDLVDVFGRDDVEIHEISCSRDGGVVAVAWNNTRMDSADVVVFGYPSLELIREHAIGDTQPAYRPFNWGLFPITVSPKGTYLACQSIDRNGVSLFDLTSSDDPTTIFASGYLPVCFDTAERIVATFTGSADPFNRFAAQINVIELANPDSLARVIKVINVGDSRWTASFGIASDGTEVFYGGGGSEFKGNRVGPRCGTWDMATGVKTREVNTVLYNWNANRISTDGRWLVVNSGGGVNSTYTTVFDRNDSLPTYQIPSYVRLISEDLTRLYRFQTRNPDSLIVYCDTLESPISTSVNEPTTTESDEWSVYPNPTDGNITVQNLGEAHVTAGLLQWQIIDVRGIAIVSGHIEFEGAHCEIPIPLVVANGQYVISLHNRGTPVMSKRFVVQR